ncbi:hypothetical protein SmJEL517_g00021 [Synchytrium microbalum]|uniref:Tr-type G domain-containing protein n=1 Tax=Synchytrium microbalum TaxID=1806994 RepID=A0A507CII9_9FUNG|nr:uncharacterized protein SmJEL517_g00021 [Synchytrium microbalum]TPX38026.1 hypothetical protein SmJEL517_g00021 [Synchytrium microbalum]
MDYRESFLDRRGHETSLPQEVESGSNIEYKLKLIDPPPERLEHLITQMKWRLAEGSGEAMYEIGVADSGKLVGLSETELSASLNTLRTMGDRLAAEVFVIRQRDVVGDTGHVRKVAEVLVRKRLTDDQHFLEVRIAVLGAFDTGKSTLLGVFSNGELDNGRGKARLNLLRHLHEIQSGRTSSVARQIIGFSPSGELINYATNNINSWEDICENSSKILTFLDLCGHPKYQRTTISGLTGHAPDYACLIVAASDGRLSEVSREHLGTAVVLAVPVFVVLTKIDLATPSQLTKTVESLLSVLKAPGIRRVPVVVQNEDDLVVAVSNFVSSQVIPIFLTSSVTGENMQLLTQFLNLLPKPVRDYDALLQQDPEFQVEELYSVPQVGCVAAGILRTGRISVSRIEAHKVYYIGPDRGRFIPCKVNSIHRQRIAVQEVKASQVATLAVSFTASVDASEQQEGGTNAREIDCTQPPTGFRLRKGQVILSEPMDNAIPKAVWEFEAEISVLNAPVGLNVGMQGTMYCGTIRQLTRIVRIVMPNGESSSSSPTRLADTALRIDQPKVALKTGKKGVVRFRFSHEPEWVKPGWIVLFREGRLKCVGKVSEIFISETSSESEQR